MPELCDDVPRRRRSAEAARRPGSLRQLPARVRRNQQHHLRRGSERPRRPGRLDPGAYRSGCHVGCRLERRRTGTGAGADRAHPCCRGAPAASSAAAFVTACLTAGAAACDVLCAAAGRSTRSRGAVLPDAERSTDGAPGSRAVTTPSEPLGFARAGRRCGSAAHSRHVAPCARRRPQRRAVVLQDAARDTAATGSAVHDRNAAGVVRSAAGCASGTRPGPARTGRKPVDPATRVRPAALV